VKNSADTIAFEIKRVGQQPERISADSCTIEGAPPSRYVFRKDDATVFDLFVYALECEPKPILGRHEGQLGLWEKVSNEIKAELESGITGVGSSYYLLAFV